MAIVPKQPVSAAVVNAAFVSKTDDDVKEGKLRLQNDAGVSGAAVDDTQKAINDNAAAIAALPDTSYVDSQDAATLASANGYTDSAVEDLDDDVTAALALKAPIASPTFTGGLEVLSTTGALIPPRMTEAQRDAITPLVDGSIIFNSTSGTLQQCKGGTWTDVGSGSGGSGINYVENPDFDENINGVAAYADAAGAAPVDGTGGSPSVTLTHGTVANGWNPLRGKGSLVFGKGASNLQGQGCAIDLEIDPADQGMVLQFTMDYAIAVGTYADGDMQVFLYDKTNSQLIYAIEGQSILKHGLVSLEHRARFQTAYNSTSYRLIFHVASTSVSSYSLYFDNLYFGPQLVNRGAVVTAWKDFTPTGSWGNTTYQGRYRQIGDSAEVEIKGALTGSVSGALSVNLPFSTPTEFMAADTGLGNASAFIGGTIYSGSVYVSSATSISFRNWTVSGSYVRHADTSNTVPTTWGSGSVFYARFTVRVSGWQSNQVLSSEVSGRPQYFAGYSTTTTITTTETQLALGATTDKAAMLSGNNVIVKENGDYGISLASMANSGAGGNDVNFTIKVNGNIVKQASVSGSYAKLINLVDGRSLNAGDVISFAAYTNTGTAGIPGAAYTSVIVEKKNAGTQQIAATEKVRAVANTSAGQSVGTSHTDIAFGTITENTHGCLDATGTTFTCNRNGTLKCTVALMSGATAINAGSAFAATLFKGGTGLRRIAATRPTASATYQYIGAATVSVPCLAGETYSVRAICDNATSLYTASSDNFVEWEIV